MTVLMAEAKIKAESVPEFQELQDGVEDRLAGPPNVQPLTVVGSYRLF